MSLVFSVGVGVLKKQKTEQLAPKLIPIWTGPQRNTGYKSLEFHNGKERCLPPLPAKNQPTAKM